MRTSLKGREVRGVLTKGLGRPDCAAQMTGGEVRVATSGGVAVRWCASSEIPTRAGPKSWKEGSVEFLVPRRSSCASCGGGGAVERQGCGGATHGHGGTEYGNGAEVLGCGRGGVVRSGGSRGAFKGDARGFWACVRARSGCGNCGRDPCRGWIAQRPRVISWLGWGSFWKGRRSGRLAGRPCVAEVVHGAASGGVALQSGAAARASRRGRRRKVEEGR